MVGPAAKSPRGAVSAGGLWPPGGIHDGITYRRKGRRGYRKTPARRCAAGRAAGDLPRLGSRQRRPACALERGPLRQAQGLAGALVRRLISDIMQIKTMTYRIGTRLLAVMIHHIF